MEGLGLCPNCKHYAWEKPIGIGKYDEEYHRKYINYAGTELGKRINQQRWGLVCKYLSGRARLLDWGCGCGSFLSAAPNGFYVDGYDVNPYSPSSYKKMLYGHVWDGVTLFDVIEHMEDPVSFIRGLNTKYLFILTPDTYHVKGDISEWRHFRPDEHQHMFSKISLKKMLDLNGYEIDEYNYDEGLLRNSENPFDLVTFVAHK